MPQESQNKLDFTGSPFRHKTRIEIRFADVDAFGHVNNAKFLTYFEQARVSYFDDVAEWPYDWSRQGVILARAEVNFLLPVHFKDQVHVFSRCSRIGSKSFDIEYQMVKSVEGKDILLADGVTVMVAFDYHTKQSIPVPAEWKAAIEKYESVR